MLDGDGKVEFGETDSCYLTKPSALGDTHPKRLPWVELEQTVTLAQAEVAEVLLYDRALNLSERRNLEDHLRLK